jgi:Fibronectin type III domain
MDAQKLLAVLACAFLSLATFSTVTMTTAASAGVPGSSWTLHPTSSSIGGVGDVAYGDGKFVAVSFNGAGIDQVMSSTDGINWTTQSDGLAAGQDWRYMIFADGLFVAVSAYPNSTNGDQVMTSPDGVNWTYRSTPPGLWSSVAYGDGTFVVVGNAQASDPIVMTSSDGVTWTAQSTPDNTTQLNSVAFGDGTFVAAAYQVGTLGYQVMTSNNGVDWVGHTVPFGCYWSNEAVAYGNGTWLIVGIASVGSPCTTATFITSTDGGSTWQGSDPGNGSDWLLALYTGSNFIVLADTYGITATLQEMTSPDAIHWTAQSVPALNWANAALGNGFLVALNAEGTYSMTTPSLVPSSPLSVAASLLSNGVQVSWSVPLDDGGSPITSYTATASPGGASCTTTSTSCVIAGLLPGTTYSVTVTAANGVGSSAASAPVSVSIPPAVELSSTGSDLFSPSWLAVALLALGGGALYVRRRRSVRSLH